MNNNEGGLNKIIFNYKKCKRYFGKNFYFWELLIAFLSIPVMFFCVMVLNMSVSTVLSFMIYFFIFIILCFVCKSFFRITSDNKYDEECFKYIDSIKNEAVLHCGINNMPADSVSKSVLCGYSGIKIKRAKTGKDGVNRSEAPEITVLFFLDDCVRYYSTKIYTLKKGAISNTSGAMYYKDIMSVNLKDELFSTRKCDYAFKTMQIVGMGGSVTNFAVGLTDYAHIIETFQKYVEKSRK